MVTVPVDEAAGRRYSLSLPPCSNHPQHESKRGCAVSQTPVRFGERRADAGGPRSAEIEIYLDIGGLLRSRAYRQVDSKPETEESAVASVGVDHCFGTEAAHPPSLGDKSRARTNQISEMRSLGPQESWGGVLRARPLTIDGLRELRSRDDRFKSIGDFGPGSIDEAHSRAAGATWVMPLAEFTRRGFKVYRPSDAIDQLLISATTLEFRRLTKVKQSNRHQVIAAVLEVLTDGIPMIVHRFDIRSFYESISRKKVEERLNEDIGLPRTTIRVVRSLFRGCDEISLSGLPRGIGISAALSEDLLRPIDRAIRLHEGIYFSCRYVDDIVLITGTDLPHAELEVWMRNLLWGQVGLKLNNRKSSGVVVNGGSSNSPAAFDFLGYKIEMRPKKNGYTEVIADIAESKARKIKSKACLAALSYIRNRDESLLRDRLKALTANYVLPGDHPGHPPRVGIYYSYPRVTNHSYDSGALRDLDDFVRILFLGTRTKLSRQIRSLLSNNTCSQLAELSFVDGHRTRRLEHFDSRRIGKIVECWKHA